MNKGIRILLVLLFLVSLSWGVYECNYYLSYASDLKDRPWAYSRDEKADLLVGTWQGEFRDPNNVAKTIRLNILPPIPDEERAKKAARRTRKRSGLGSRTDKKRFDGFATVTSSRGKEDYQFNGHVLTEDGHQLNVIQFSTSNEIGPIRNNFNLHSSLKGGTWQGQNLTLTLAFTFTTNTGSSYSNSADSRYDKQVTVHLSRIQS